jgi:hypothetical protein
MTDYDTLTESAKREINMLSGSMNLPPHEEYSDLAAFLHDVHQRIGAIKSILKQAINLAGE